MMTTYLYFIPSQWFKFYTIWHRWFIIMTLETYLCCKITVSVKFISHYRHISRNAMHIFKKIICIHSLIITQHNLKKQCRLDLHCSKFSDSANWFSYHLEKKTMAPWIGYKYSKIWMFFLKRSAVFMIHEIQFETRKQWCSH